MSNPVIIDLDLRKKACPLPVVETRKAFLSLDENAAEVIITVQLDNQAACANVTRFAESQHFTVSQETHPDQTFTLTITRGFICETGPVAPSHNDQPKRDRQQNYLLYIDNCCMGSGDEKLGRILMKAFLKTLPELDTLPETIIFVNSGVFLTTSDSSEISTLKALAGTGCNLLVCGTCLDFYNLKEQLAVGQISNMFEIATLLTVTSRVVRL
ncbi:MAG: sulfurtransferase-like selenium metabolism protein YedF [Deltaproteobacteria bacterium]|nr:sulfurtransferase-like selenium metabolism protein YedF [Deltaproteobacteria bacterium]